MVLEPPVSLRPVLFYLRNECPPDCWMENKKQERTQVSTTAPSFLLSAAGGEGRESGMMHGKPRTQFCMGLAKTDEPGCWVLFLRHCPFPLLVSLEMLLVQEHIAEWYHKYYSYFIYTKKILRGTYNVNMRPKLVFSRSQNCLSLSINIPCDSEGPVSKSPIQEAFQDYT